MSYTQSQVRRNPQLATRLRALGLGRLVDSPRLRAALGVPQNQGAETQKQNTMRIGLIGINIYAKFLNFACDLHVLAFQEFLKSEGHRVAILDYKPVHFGNFDMRHPQEYTNRMYQRALEIKATTPEEEKKRRIQIQKWKTLSEGYESVRTEREIRYDKFQKFASKHLQLTEQKYDSDLLEVLDPGLDCYICVTDVIWQSVEQHKFDRGFLLGSRAFEGKPKIAYAASRGASKDYSEVERDQFLKYLADIDDVSVREEDFKQYIGSMTDKKVATTLDPVMLHNQDFWNRYTSRPAEKKYVLLYYVMEKSTDTIQKAVEYAKANDLILVELSDRPLKNGKVTDSEVKHIARYDVGMDEWLGYIKYADTVFTNSFHGCCFSVIFEKNFYAGPRNGSKVKNFLETFGLNSRRFDKQTALEEFSQNTNYSGVRRRWAAERERSEAFIRSALTKAQERVNRTLLIDHSRFDEERRGLEYRVLYHSGKAVQGVSITPEAANQGFIADRVPSGALEGAFDGEIFRNNGTQIMRDNPFKLPTNSLVGWNLRFKVDNRWFWMMEDGTINATGRISPHSGVAKFLVRAGECIPYLPVNNIAIVVLEAQWQG